MRKAEPPQPPAVKKLAAGVLSALGARNLSRPVRAVYVPGVPCWKVAAEKIEVRLDPSFPGRWRLNMSWTMVPIPPSGDLVVQESSIGLYGAQVPALGGGGEEVCLVRYDTDLTEPGATLAPLGAHINVLQPGRLEDKVHYVLPGHADHEWRLPDVLDFLMSDRLVRDLTGRLH